MRDVSRSEAKKEQAITIVTRAASVHSQSGKKWKNGMLLWGESCWRMSS
ncbi:hypothetical protein ABRP59_12390 [Pectobacterium punjabense]